MNQNHTKKPTTALVVAGMHRSGTSAIARILNLLGAKMPGNLMTAHSEFNPTGFWESIDVVSINDRLLASAESHWDEMYAFDIDALSPTTRSQFHADISTLIERDFSRESCFIIKDPRIARTLPLWLEALRRSQHDVKIIIPARHPLEVAASLARRDGFSVDKSVYLWLRYMLDSIRYAASDGYGIVVYDELIQDWRTSIESLRKDLKINWPIDVVTASPAIDRFLDEDLRHHQFRIGNMEVEGKPHNPLAELASQLYDALLNRAPDLVIRANEIHNKLSALEIIFLPLLADYRRQRQFNIKQQNELNLKLGQVCSNVNDLENLLNEERLVFKKLDAEFNIKCEHVIILQDNIHDLHKKIDELKVDNKHPDVNIPQLINYKFNFLTQLQEIELMIKEKQVQLFSLNQAICLQQLEFQDEIKRAEAQLSLLKDLFQDKF
jgi:hypothetical protein